MSDDLYHPPVMHLYFDDFIADTTDLSNEELGAYVRLMHRQWNTAAIPADPARAGSIAHGTSRQRMKSILAAIGERLQPHPKLPGHLQTPRMEDVREDQRKHAELYRTRAQNAVAAREQKRAERKTQEQPKTNLGLSQDEPKTNLWLSTPYSDLQDHSPSARADASAREAEKALATAADADTLSDYLLDTAVEHGFQMGHHALDRRAWHHANREYGLKLIAAYELEPCKIRALALIVAIKSGKITSRQIGTALLFRCWNYRELTDVVKAADAGQTFDEMMGVA